MARVALGKIAAGLFAAATLAVAMPVAAQIYSNGYQFLEAVKDKHGEDATKLINENKTIVNTRDLSTGETGLHIATERRDLTWVQFLIQEGANPNIRDNRGVSPLALAVQLGFQAGVAELLKAGARVDDANDAGETPLIFAVHRNDEDLMRLLLENGADPERTDNSGRSARDYASLSTRAAIRDVIETHVAENGTDDSTYGPVF